MRIILVLIFLALAIPVFADELPAMRSGMWEFTRKAPMDPFNNPGKLNTFSNKKCIKDMKEHFGEQAKMAKICKSSEIHKAGNSYTTTTVCDTPQGKVTGKNITTVNGDSAYESKIETEGTMAGKPVKWTEYLNAKRIGNCP